MMATKSEKKSQKRKKSNEASTSGWMDPTVLIPLISVIVAGAASLADPIASVLNHDTPSIDCASEYRKYAELQDDYPQRDLSLPGDSEVERQCKINRFLASIEPKLGTPRQPPDGPTDEPLPTSTK